MGRELKRVPLDFDWPLNEPWSGYINHLYDVAIKCAACHGDGCSLVARRFKDQWYGCVPFQPEDRGSVSFTSDDPPVRAVAERLVVRLPEFYGRGEIAIRGEANRLCALYNTQWSHHLDVDDVAALLDAGRLYDFTHDFVPGRGWIPKEPPATPMPQQVNDWSLSGMGHDSINQWVCVKARCKRLGEPYMCAACGGDGLVWPSAEAKAAAEAWERTKPPVGEGYQIWETVSEGSPISPVFATPEELAKHMAGTRWGADDGTPYDVWLDFIKGPGWAPSMVGTSTGLVSGVEAMVVMQDKD